MIRVPLYREGEIVYARINDETLSVMILQTSIVVEEEEIYYKVCSHANTKREFVVSEDDILRGLADTPVPAYGVGTFVMYNHPRWPNGPEGEVSWDVHSGIIEEINILITEEGYTISYKTDDHPAGASVLEDDIVEYEYNDREEEEETLNEKES